MKKYIDLIGQKFGRLTVISQAETVKDSKGYDVRQWNCICDCGNKEIKVVKEHYMVTARIIIISRTIYTFLKLKNRCYNVILMV